MFAEGYSADHLRPVPEGAGAAPRSFSRIGMSLSNTSMPAHECDAIWLSGLGTLELDSLVFGGHRDAMAADGAAENYGVAGAGAAVAGQNRHGAHARSRRYV